MNIDCLHIHAQPCWHESAYIVGTHGALAALRDAIDRALAFGRPDAMESFARDGEGYTVVVMPVAGLDDADALPYTAPYDGWCSVGEHPYRRLSAEDRARIFGRAR